MKQIWSFIDRVMTDFRDYHMPALLLIFFTGSTLWWFKRLDASYLTFTGTIVTAITGHAIFSPTQQKDQQAPTPSGLGTPGEKG